MVDDQIVRRPKFCQECGGRVTDGDRFCGGCGSAIQTLGAASEQALEESKSSPFRQARPPILLPARPPFKVSRVGLFSVLGALFLAAIGVKAYSAIETSQDRSGYLAQFGGIDHQLDDLDDILSRWERQNVVIYDEDTKLKALFDSPPDNLGLMFPSIKPADDRLMRALKDFGQLPESPSESIRRDLKGRNSIPTSELGALIEQEQAKRSYALTEYHAAMAEFRSQLKQIKERLGIQ